MIIIGILLNIVGLGVVCWAAIHARRLCAAVLRRHDRRRSYTYRTGTGPIGAIVVGFVAGALRDSLAGRYALLCRHALPPSVLSSPLLFAAPAACAGYEVTLGLAHIGMPSEWWRDSRLPWSARSASDAPPGRAWRY